MTAREYRRSKGLTVQQVAQKLRRSEELVRKAERPGGGASFEMARKLAALYGCPMVTFIGRPQPEKER